MLYVVTGAAGFIGSNIVKALNDRGVAEIVAVDEAKHGPRPANLSDCSIAEYAAKEDFIGRLGAGAYRGLAAIFHQGANSDTTVTERDRASVMETNLHYSERLLDWCAAEKVPLIYASSAAIYGSSREFREGEHEDPLNIYGDSKLQFDQVVRRRAGELKSQVVGLRYFNVYGERESHKGRMASVAFHFFNQYREAGYVRLFEGSGGYGDGEQRRDFVSVEDCVKVNLWFLDHPGKSGIFNVGTGAAQSFNDVAVATINECRKARGEVPLTLAAMREKKIIRYIPFPDDLKGRYQSYTQADVSALRAAGYAAPFLTVEQGVVRYCQKLLRSATI